MYRFGFFCSTSDNRLSTNRTTTLKNLTYENIEKKVKQNAKELIQLLAFSQSEEFPIFRLGNAFVPFLSHKQFNPEWLEALGPIFDEVKERLQGFPNLRITQHPGQYTVLNSPKPEVIENALRELERCFWLFDRLGIGDDGTILIHGGGAYGDKEMAMARLVATIKAHGWLNERLALENDERTYNAQEILSVCEETKIPMVFDCYHHALFPSPLNAQRILDTWGTIRPKMHLSSKGEGRFGNHADFIEAEDFFTLRDDFGEALKEVDIMVEAKQKEHAIARLRKDIA